MRAWPRNPVVHEIFTWTWLAELGRRYRRPVTLADVPDEAWDEVARPGVAATGAVAPRPTGKAGVAPTPHDSAALVDAVWLMGVWERSPLGAQIARTNPGMRAANLAALPDLGDADVVGSAYCIRDYVVDQRLGGESGLAIARATLARRGVRLVLDLVPNHVAPDHRWVREHPEFFIEGSPADLAREPHAFIKVGDRVLACGRDPNFPAWPEVLQLDGSALALRAAMVELVGSLTRRCDGVRCDMAMLMLDDVFARTWGNRAKGGPHPDGGRGY
jgi:Alpha amylase, catalytic domain